MSEDERYREFLRAHDRLFERHGYMCQAVMDDLETEGCEAAGPLALVAAYQRLLDADPEVAEFQARFPDTDSVWRRHREEAGGLSIFAPMMACPPSTDDAL